MVEMPVKEEMMEKKVGVSVEKEEVSVEKAHNQLL